MQIVLRGDRSVAPALRRMASKGKSDNARINALWTLQGLGELDADLVSQALKHPSNRVQMTATRLAEPWLGEGHPAISKAIDARLARKDASAVGDAAL